MAERSDKANKTASTDSGPVTIFAKSRKNRAKPSAAEPRVDRPARKSDGKLGLDFWDSAFARANWVRRKRVYKKE